MTDTTSTWGLTRTTPLDDPKQQAAYLQELAMDVDARMVGAFYHLNRSKNFPAACIRKTVPEVMLRDAPFPQITFDTVAFDNAGMVDLSANPKSIQITAEGFWCIGGYLQCSGFGGSPGDVGIWLKHAGSTTTATTHDGAFGLVGISHTLFERITAPLDGTDTVALGYTAPGVSTGTQTTVQFAEIWAYKIRDL